nr:translation initiation factor IF-2-like [Rattus norvegicus]
MACQFSPPKELKRSLGRLARAAPSPLALPPGPGPYSPATSSPGSLPGAPAGAPTPRGEAGEERRAEKGKPELRDAKVAAPAPASHALARLPRLPALTPATPGPAGAPASQFRKHPRVSRAFGSSGLGTRCRRDNGERGLLEAAQGQRRRDRGGKGCGSGGGSSDGDGVRQGKFGPVALHRRTFATVPRRSIEELASSLWVWKRSLDTSQGTAGASMF